MKIIGYGEDALTLFALKEHLRDILNDLEDNTDSTNCLIFYRPSFGRGKHGFGEFDAILSTQKNIYLIESKWDKLQEKRNNEYKLEYNQIRRHIIFSAFYNNDSNGFKNNIPPEGSLQARNLFFIINKLKEHGNCKDKKLINLLLYFYNGKTNKNIQKSIKTKLTAKNKKTEKEIAGEFIILNFDYSKYLIYDNFIDLNS